jgi:hypothetical protein
MKLHPNNRLFKFSNRTCRSLGSLKFKVPVPKGTLDIYVDVVEQSVPLLLGLDLLDRYWLQLLTISNELENISVEWSSWRLPVTRKVGHGFLEWDVKNFIYTKSQLVKLHKHLYNYTTCKFLKLLKPATPDLVTPETKILIDEIFKAFHDCQVYSSGSHLSIRTPEDVILNQELRFYLMFLEDIKPALHVLDAGTTFQATKFIEGEDAKCIWNAFIRCWSHALCGHPASVICD